MSELNISFEGRSLDDIPLNKETITIGRHPDNDIELADDRAVSGHHAVIITIMSDSFLEDLDSTNGTLVNGRQVSKHPLLNGDVIQVGRHNLKYVGQVTDDEDNLDKKG
jgi:pSer/pThr/pTyr-binding forkhead associated (FHA) protein